MSKPFKMVGNAAKKLGGKMLNTSKAVFRKMASQPTSKDVRKIQVTKNNIKENCIGTSCFVAGTRVKTDVGWCPIENIKPGDRVYSRNENSGETGYRRVINTFVTQNRRLTSITVRGGDADHGQVITGTRSHPIWSASARGWLPLEGLRFGEAVMASDGSSAWVIGLVDVDVEQPVQTYNLTVDGWHTYFVAGVGETSIGVWVHNTQKRACDVILGDERAAYQAAPNINLFKGNGRYAKLKPYQKFLIGANGKQIQRPSTDKIDLSTVRPKGYDLESDVWHGEVSFELKKNGKRVVFKNGFPDFTAYKYKAPAGKKSEVTVDCVRDSEKEIEQAWAKSGFTAAEQAKLQKTHVWHHTVDLKDKKVKVILVDRSVHDKADGGYAHSGGFAVSKWLLDNDIPF